MTGIPVYDVFVSYNRNDVRVVEPIARWLRDNGLRPFVDCWDLQPGRPWQEELEKVLPGCRAVAVFIGPGELGPWQQKEKRYALDLQTRRNDFLVIPVLLPGCDPPVGFLAENNWIDLRAGTQESEALGLLARAIRGQPPGSNLESYPDGPMAHLCPYRGLLYFREEDEPFFFGRAEAVERLAASVGERRLVALVGPSGCGKSSIIRAGLIPRLRREHLPRWEIRVFFPGDDPFRSLAAAFISASEPNRPEVDHLCEASRLSNELHAGRVSIADVARRLKEKGNGDVRPLFVIDQWEELYTHTTSEDLRRRFAEGILEANRVAGLTTVVTLRGDFVDRALSHRALSDELQGALVNLGPMVRKELADAVRLPAQKTKLRFEPGLSDRILDDVGDEPGNLPLVEYLLERMWEERRLGFLTHESYDRMGGVRGAIATTAESFFDALTEREKDLVRTVFLRLVRTGERGQDSRRRVRISDLGEEAAPIVQRLADKRLVVTTQAAGMDTAEISHEALIRQWGRLQRWIDADRQFLLWREVVESRVKRWREDPDDEGNLLRGTLLSESKDWIKERGKEIDLGAREFVSASAVAHRERAEQELLTARRLSRRLKATVISVGMGLFVAVILLVWVNLARRHANVAREQANTARTQAEQLVTFMVFDLREKLEPIGRLDILKDVNEKVERYYSTVGVAGNDAASARLQSVALDSRGNILLLRGDLEGAFQAFEASRAIAERLLAHDVDSAARKFDLAVSHDNIGLVLHEQGKLDDAFVAFQAGRAIMKQLADQDPADPRVLRGLAVSDNRIGDVLVELRRLPEAAKEFRAAHALFVRLADRLPSELGAQSDLARSGLRLADVLLSKGDVDEALAMLVQVRETFKWLLKREPASTIWQREKSVSGIYLGIALSKTGKLEDALTAFSESREILERLVRDDPSNHVWQSDLAIDYSHIGATLAGQRKFSQALAALKTGRGIVGTLAKTDPSSARWRQLSADINTKIAFLHEEWTRAAIRE
jgi:tetratricopeptide (TPR) repeat protein/energy-coupling factor transporter ATP-binding protein EcfA2